MINKRGNEMNKRKLILILIGITIISWIITILSIPKKNELNTVREQLSQIERQIAIKRRTAIADSPLSNKFDLVNAQQKAQTKLKQAFSVMYGGLHSKKDVKENTAMFKQILGVQLMDKGLTDAMSGDNFFIEKNDSVDVVFGDISDKTDTTIQVIVSYKMKGRSETQEVNKEANSYTQIYTLHYDLVQQKVNSFSSQSITRGSNK